MKHENHSDLRLGQGLITYGYSVFSTIIKERPLETYSGIADKMVPVGGCIFTGQVAVLWLRRQYDRDNCGNLLHPFVCDPFQTEQRGLLACSQIQRGTEAAQHCRQEPERTFQSRITGSKTSWLLWRQSNGLSETPTS